MNKKILPIVIFVLVSFVAILVISIVQYRQQRPTILETIPLIGKTTPTPTVRLTTTPTPTSLPGISKQVDTDKATTGIPDEVSFAEKNKILDALPIRVDNFKTGNNFQTTINIFNATYDPVSSMRIEIYNINYNNLDITSQDALAFRDSFVEVKKLIAPYRVNLRNLQIIFGNRQYIQDTATYWVKTFGLLD